MPTGYTCDINKGITFNQFAMTCARAFGATIDMREDPIDAPIPVFEPSPYYAEQIEAAKRDIARFEAMTDAEAEQLALTLYLDAVESNNKYRADKTELKAKYEAMLAEIDIWVPPTPDHAEMKAFMRNQITESIKWDCGSDYLHEPERKTGAAYRTEMLARSRENLERGTAENEKEVERTRSRNEWVAALKASLV